MGLRANLKPKIKILGLDLIESPLSPPSDANISDLSKERLALNETEPKTKKKHRASSFHGRTPSASSLVVAIAQPHRSP